MKIQAMAKNQDTRSKMLISLVAERDALDRLKA